MEVFQYTQAKTAGASRASRSDKRDKFVAGGTTLIDLMKLNVERPRLWISILATEGDGIRAGWRTENRRYGSQQRFGAR